MATSIHRLRITQVKNARPGSKLCDGGGLWLYVSPAGARSWVFRYRLHGTNREMGLGPVHDVPLADARVLASQCRALKRDGTDPIYHREKKRQQARLEIAGGITFRNCVDAYLSTHQSAWTNAKHAQQWRNTLDQYASAEFGDLRVQKIDTGVILRALEKIWYGKPETASRVRQRIEAVLDWATARSYRTGENPARWRGHLDKLLPKHTKLKKVVHHAALPWREMGTFMADLRQQDGFAARALELTILCATRTRETLGATWDEFDLHGRTWIVPGDRMKAKREHRIPLSQQAVTLLDLLPKAGPFVFPGQRYGKPFSNMAMLIVLRRMKRGELTVHGFRSTFRDWCAEATNYPRELAESALAHVLNNKVEAAYQRGDLFAKRAKLMQAWADWSDQTDTAAVTPIRQAV